MAPYYPPVGFHFKVEVLGLPPNENDARFSEVSGLTVEVGTEEVSEGGENRFVQKYPLRRKYPEMVLKRGLLTSSEVFKWIQKHFVNDAVELKNVDVKLLNEDHEPLVTWHLANAFPTKWSLSDLNATSNAVAVETLQMYYQYFTIEKR